MVIQTCGTNMWYMWYIQTCGNSTYKHTIIIKKKLKEKSNCFLKQSNENIIEKVHFFQKLVQVKTIVLF